MGRLRSAFVILFVTLAMGACGGAPPVIVPPSETSAVSETPLVPIEATTDAVPLEEVEVVPAELTFTCGSGVGTELHSLAEAWSPDQGQLYDCTATVPADYSPTPQEQAAADAYEKAAGTPAYGTSLEALLGLCASAGRNEESLMGVEHPLMTNALKICPKAPHAPSMRLVLAGDVFLDGSNSVGTDIRPGTYRTDPPTHDCYWERTTASGGTIANDFVTFAPKGVTVTIRKSDGGFTSTDCGVWKRVR